MNPSTQELLDAVESLPAEKLIILPNNPNVIMAARQAAELSKKQVVVVPTRTVPQGIAAQLIQALEVCGMWRQVGGIQQLTGLAPVGGGPGLGLPSGGLLAVRHTRLAGRVP